MPKFISAIALLLTSSLWAQQITIDFDPARTEIHWSLGGNVHTTHGTFRLKQGRITFDPSTGTISGELVADAASGESGNGARDKRMSKEILESEKYPEFRFLPRKVEGPVRVGTHSTVHIGGTFMVHGTAHNVTVPMEVSLADGSLTGSGKFSIPFVDWGLKDPSNFLFKVDKSVEVEILTAGKVQAK